MKIFRLLLAGCALIQLPFSAQAQITLINPSFEGTTGTGVMPAPWPLQCGTPDTGPGVFGIDLPASNGNTYIGLWDGGPLLGSCTGGNGEGTSQILPTPLTAGITYNLELDVAWDLNGSASYTQGASLDIYGGMTLGAKTQLLWSGAPSAPQVWQRKSAIFTPASNWKYISFYAKSGSGSKYVMLDNLGTIDLSSNYITATSASCGGNGHDGSATVTMPADGTSWHYLWSNGATTATITGLTPGTYTCTITDPSGNHPVPLTLAVDIKGPSVSANPATICLGSTSQLLAGSDIQELDSTCTFALNLFDTFGDGWTAPAKVEVYVNSVLKGTYKLATGSAGANPISVVQGDQVQLIYTAGTNYNNENSFELRDASGAILYTSGVNPSAGIKYTNTISCGYVAPPTGSYIWDASPTLSSTTIQNPVASPTVTTTYHVTITDPDNPSCITTLPVTVTVLSPTTPTFTPLLPVCQNSTVVLPTISLEGIVGSWSPAISTAAAGIFTYTFTPVPGQCGASTATITLTVMPLPANPVITAGGPTVFCAGGSVTLTSSESSDIVWSDSQTTPFVTASANGTWSVIYTAANGCKATSNSIVVEIDIPTVDAGLDSMVCSGDPVTLTGSGSATSYAWDNGVTDGVAFTPSGTVTYNVTGTDNLGCQNTDQVTLTETFIIPVNAGTDRVACPGESVTLTGSGSGDTYTWDNGVTDGVAFTPPATQTYTVTGVHGLCSGTDQVTITVSSPVTPTFTALTAVCEDGAAPSLLTTSTNGINGTWIPAAFTTDDAGTFPAEFTPASGQCATKASLSLTVNPAVTPTFSTLTNVCQDGTPPLLPPTSHEGIPGTWLPAILTTAAPGTETTTFTPDGGQCATKTTLILTINEPVTPGFIAPADVCQGDPAPVLPTVSDNGISGSWDPLFTTDDADTVFAMFTPTPGECATQVHLGLIIRPVPIPDFSTTDVTTGCIPLSVNFSSSTAGDDYQWIYAPGIEETEHSGNGSHTYTSEACFDVTLTVTKDGCTGSVTHTDFVCANDCAGLTENTVVSVSLFPNPSTGLLNIQADNVLIKSVTVYDNAGRLVQLVDAVNSVTALVDLSKSADGVYTFVIETAVSNEHMQVILKK